MNQDEASPTNGRLGSALRILSCLLQGCLGCWRSHHSLMSLPSPSPVVRTLEGAPVGLQQWRVPTRIFPGTSFTDLRVGHLKRRHRSFLLFWFVLSVVNIVIIYTVYIYIFHTYIYYIYIHIYNIITYIYYNTKLYIYTYFSYIHILYIYTYI